MSDDDLEQALRQWVRWCYWTEETGGHAIGSAEKYWRSPQCWEMPQPRPDAPDEWIGLRVERSVRILPERNKAVLRMEYLCVATLRGKSREAWPAPGETKEQRQQRKRRALQMSEWDYDETLYRARIMLRNVMRSTGNKR